MTLNYGDYQSGHDLIKQVLYKQSFLWPVTGEGRLEAWEDLMCHCWLEVGGGSWGKEHS